MNQEPSQSPCRTEDAVVEMIRARGKFGREKYGVSMDRRDLEPDEWVTHHQEELADALQYAERMKGVTKLLREAREIMMTLNDERGWDIANQWLARYDEQFLPGDCKPERPACEKCNGSGSQVISVKEGDGFWNRCVPCDCGVKEPDRLRELEEALSQALAREQQIRNYHQLCKKAYGEKPNSFENAVMIGLEAALAFLPREEGGPEVPDYLREKREIGRALRLEEKFETNHHVQLTAIRDLQEACGRVERGEE